MKEQDAQAKLSLKLQAYQYLKTKILNCEYRPNEFLNEQKLCAGASGAGGADHHSAQKGFDGLRHHRRGRAQHV